MNLVEMKLQRLAYRFRREVWGKLKLRPGLPAPDSGPATDGERSFYRLVLSRALPAETRDAVTAAWDVGCRNWSYAAALAAMFPNADLLGVELDGGRRYFNLYRRMDQAEANAAELRGQGRQVCCKFDDFRNLDVRPDSAQGKTAFCFFFPFVSEWPCLQWGLPAEYSEFDPLLAHALEGAAAGKALIVSCHQGEWEAEIARAAYRRARLQAVECVVKPEEFRGLWPSPHPIHVFTASP